MSRPTTQMSAVSKQPIPLLRILISLLASVMIALNGNPALSQSPNPEGRIQPLAPAKELTQIRLWHRNFDAKQTRGLLDLALSKTTREYGGYEILRGAELSQRRAMASLIQNNTHHLDVINAVVDDEREKSLIPIRVVSDEGLIGYRVCLIHKEEAPRFDAIRSHQDITDSGIIFGQGAHWPDTKILRENALQVMTSVHYESLFSMLLARRFHCFLRGANEALDDLERHKDERLMIEPSLLFSYPSTSTFFVNKSNVELAARIELGIRRSILDGSFKKYFEEFYEKDLEILDLKSRRIIRFNNPYISDDFLEKSTQRYILKSSLKGDFDLQ